MLPTKISPTVDQEVDMELEKVDPGHKGDQITTAAAINPPVKNEPELEVRASKRRARKPAVVEVSESEDSDAPLVCSSPRIYKKTLLTFYRTNVGNPTA